MIFIVLDTNILDMSYSRNAAYDSFFLNKNFEEIVSSISEEQFRDEVRLLIPQIVLDELYRHKVEAYERDMADLKRIEVNMASIADIKYVYDSLEEYKKLLLQKGNEFFAMYPNVSIIPICSDCFFRNIVEKAVKKEAPFEGREKNSDKGFKDAVIFYSIVDYALSHQGEYIYITKDDKFHGSDGILLCKQFKEMCGKSLRTYKEYKEVKPEIMPLSVGKYMEHMEFTITEQKYFLGRAFDQVATILTYSRPVFEVTGNALERIKYDIDRIYDGDMALWKQHDLQKYDGEEDMEYCGDLRADVRYNKNGMWSVVFVHYAYQGGIHGGSWYTYRLYDLNTGEQISLPELLNKSEEEILWMVYEGCKQDKFERKAENLYFDDFEAKYESIEDVKFYLDEEGVHVYFDEYEAGCYASGIIEFLLVPIDMIDIPGIKGEH